MRRDIIIRNLYSDNYNESNRICRFSLKDQFN